MISVHLRWDDFPIIDSSFRRTPALIVFFALRVTKFSMSEADDDEDSGPQSHAIAALAGLLLNKEVAIRMAIQSVV